MSDIAVSCAGLSRQFDEAGRTLVVLREINLAVEAGESLAIVGQSGSGKSTLLQLLGGLDRPTQGTVQLLGQSL